MPGAVGVLLAAGVGARFGADKLLHRLEDGRTVAVTAADHLLKALPFSIAVIRPGDEVLEALLRNAGMRIVSCALAARGMGHSLACGVAAVSDADAWVIALADMPYIRSATLRRIVEGLHAGAAMVAPYYAGHRGHPVAFDRRFHGELLSLEGDIGARRLVERHLDRVYRIDVDDPGVLQDIDTPADLKRALLSAV
jgi:molybdenum cofactor cytidylyltransferase